MALSALHTWVPGELLRSADLNAEFANIRNNPIALISPTTGAINFALQSHTNLLPVTVSGTSGSTGNVLTVSALGQAVWAAPDAVTSTGIRILQWQRGSVTNVTFSSTTPTALTGAAVAITPASTNSKIVIAYSGTGSINAQNGIAAQGNFDIATSSGILTGAPTVNISANNVTAIGLLASIAWTHIADASPAPYPTTYQVRGYSDSSTQAGVQGSLIGLNMFLVELSS